VESSVLASVLYQPKPRLLEVEFRSGQFWKYFDVPLQSYTQLLAAHSKGEYFNLHIRNRFLSQQIRSHRSAGRLTSQKLK
jgi:hypothetical protein